MATRQRTSQREVRKREGNVDRPTPVPARSHHRCTVFSQIGIIAMGLLLIGFGLRDGNLLHPALGLMNIGFAASTLYKTRPRPGPD